jgi:hypothetical protein
MKKTMFLLAVIAISAYSCKKENPEPQPTPTTTTCSVSDNKEMFNGSWYLDTAYLISNSDGSTSNAFYPYIGENVTINVGNQEWLSDQQGGKQLIINCEDFNINDGTSKLFKVVYLNEFEMLIEEQSATPTFNFDRRFLYKR